MAEEFSRGRVDPIGTAAEINAVQIELEDLVLAELPLERHRQDAFLDLAHEIAVVGQEDVAGELLRDRRRRADAMAGRHGRGESAADADRIDADMTSEAAVL